MRHAAVTIDTDPLADLVTRHGRPAPTGAAADVVWDRAMPRLADQLARHGVRATIFVVARELDRPAVRARVRELHDAGHEIASHSLDHPVPFDALDDAERGHQLDEAARRLQDVTGAPVVGFRAPSWGVSGPLLADLEARGYRYDASVLPTPAVMLLGAAYRRSTYAAGRSLGRPGVHVRAPVAPYHPDPAHPHRRGAMRLLEIPGGATAGPRLPYWFSPALAFGAPFVRAVRPWVRRSPVPQWLLHGVDLLAPDELPSGVPLRRGLARPLAHKQALLDRILRDLADHTFLPLREVADVWA